MKKKMIWGVFILILITVASVWLVFLSKNEAAPSVSQSINTTSTTSASSTPTPTSTLVDTSATVQAETFPYPGIARVYPSFKVASVNSTEETFDYWGCGDACRAMVTTTYEVVPKTSIIANQTDVPFQDIAVGDNVIVRGIPQADGSILAKQVFLNVTSSEQSIFITGVNLQSMLLTGKLYLYYGTPSQNNTSQNSIIDPSHLSGEVTLQLIPQTEVRKGTATAGQYRPTVSLSDLKVGDLADILEMQQGKNWVALDINVGSSHPSQK